MEESEKRRERLRALRQESQSETVTDNNQQHEHQHLANPLVDLHHHHHQHVQPRFDYYTDPLSAYSSHKHPHPGPTNSAISQPAPPVPYYRPPPPPPPHQGIPTFNSPPYRPPYFHSPIRGRGTTPYPLHQGTSNFTPHTQGLGFHPAPTLTSGRGRAQQDGSTFSGSRGRGRAQSTSYYDRSMLEDPWKFLTPIIWRTDTHEATFPNSWGSLKLTSIARLNERPTTMNSTAGTNQGPVTINYAAKKPRLSNSSHKSSTEPSLAEFLAAAAAEAEGDESGTV